MGKASKTKVAPSSRKEEVQAGKVAPKHDNSEVSKEVIAEHLPPIGLVFTVIACSGFLFVFSFRDAFATGKIVGGTMDEAFQIFTKSLMFYKDKSGWKSQQGGLSAIQPVTTDENNMGGFFVRKLVGVTGLALQLQKLMPLIFHPLNARWKMGHFRPLFSIAAVSNMILAAFYGSYMKDFAAAGTDGLPKIFIAVLAFEAMVIFAYLFQSRKVKRGPAVALEEGKTHRSVVSRIVARTVALVSGAMALIAGRDFFFPGEILTFIPRDDIYLEWTNAFFHSPPEDTPESELNGMVSELFVADKFLSQLLGLNLLILCMYKFVSAFLIRYGSDGSGLPKARMIWKAQTVANCLILMLFRLFSPAALTASLDLRWHLMAVAYEAFILGSYGFL